MHHNAFQFLLYFSRNQANGPRPIYANTQTLRLKAPLIIFIYLHNTITIWKLQQPTPKAKTLIKTP